MNHRMDEYSVCRRCGMTAQAAVNRGVRICRPDDLSAKRYERARGKCEAFELYIVDALVERILRDEQ